MNESFSKEEEYCRSVFCSKERKGKCYYLYSLHISPMLVMYLTTAASQLSNLWFGSKQLP